MEKFGFFCIKNKKHPGYIAKRSWLRQRFEEGMRIQLILTPDGQQAGFLEYIPGEYTWRVIHAPNYLVILCIMVGKNFSDKDLGSALLKDCLNDAKASGKLGVAVVTSDDSFLASREIFIKNGFEQV
ncbi:GNAT family N-acetyltransferase, partial [bacterium]|nr:GNAT family N-acetyltransferase [bacterium]